MSCTSGRRARTASTATSRCKIHLDLHRRSEREPGIAPGSFFRWSARSRVQPKPSSDLGRATAPPLPIVGPDGLVKDWGYRLGNRGYQQLHQLYRQHYPALLGSHAVRGVADALRCKGVDEGRPADLCLGCAGSTGTGFTGAVRYAKAGTTGASDLGRIRNGQTPRSSGSGCRDKDQPARRDG